MMELKGEEAGLKCQLSGATCWFRIEISISQGLGIVSLVFQVYLLLSGSSNISNSKNKFSISHCLSLTITLPKVLRCWWLHTNQILCSKVYDKFPTKVQDYRLPPNFSNYDNILDSLKTITEPMKWLFLEVHQLYLNVQDLPYTAPPQRLIGTDDPAKSLSS